MDIECQNFWERVKLLSKDLKLTQIEICNTCNINYQTYKGWILQGKYPNAKEICKIANLLHTSVEYLIDNRTVEDYPNDIIQAMNKLKIFTSDERKPIIALINSQIDYWKTTLEK